MHSKPLLHDSQYGIRPRMSTVTQLLVMLDKIYSAIENDCEIIVVSTDFCKAFDTVDHGILLQKLSKYGIGLKVLKLIHSYLNGLTQTVRVNGNYSSELVITCGVPQGSLLGRLFFLVYINDTANCDSPISPLFADDAKFLGLIISSMTFQNDLDRLYEWSIKTSLYFNHAKCAHVNFNGESYPLYFENNQITMKKDQKDLGLLIDSGLMWKTHIEKACSKANAVFFQIKRNVSNLFMETKLELYKSMIVATLIYASSCIILSKYVSRCLENLENEW